MTIVVSMVCETYIDPPVSDPSQITRDHLKCKIIYCSKSKFALIIVAQLAPLPLLPTIKNENDCALVCVKYEIGDVDVGSRLNFGSRTL